MAISRSRTVVSPATQTVTGVSGAIEGAGLRTVLIGVNITASSGTTPTLVCSLEWSNDDGTTWFASDPADQFTSRSTPGGWIKVFTAKGDTYRVRWTIGGTSPSFTFSVVEVVQ